MAEGGGEFGYKDTELDNRIDHDDDGDGEQEGDATRPFHPGSASTPYQPGDPYHGGEQREMSCMRHEQSGLPDTSYAETSFFGEDIPLLETDSERKFVIERLKRVFTNFKESSFAIMKGTKEKTKGKIVAVGTGGGEYKIMKDDGVNFTQSFLDKFADKIGPRAADVIVEDRDTVREMKKRQKEAEKQLQQAEKLASQREQEKKELEVLRRKIDSKIDAIQDEHGSNLESEAEMRRLKELKKNYQNALENKKKALDSLTKKQETWKKNKKRSIVSGPGSRQKKVKQTPWKKGSTKQNVGRPERAGKRAAAPKRGGPGDHPR